MDKKYKYLKKKYNFLVEEQPTDLLSNNNLKNKSNWLTLNLISCQTSRKNK